MTDTLSEARSLPRAGSARLHTSLVRGIAWTSAMKWLSQTLTWVCTIAIARVLTPADYGLVGMALLYMELITLVTELGLGSAIVAQRQLTSGQIAQLNSLSVILGAGGFVMSCAAAIPLSTFFGVPELRWIVLAMSLSCVVTALRAVPSALLERDLQFKTLSIMEALQSVAGALVVLLFAWFGFGYWALVLGGLASRVLWTALILSRRRHGFAWPRFHAIGDALTYSWHLLVSRLSWYAQANSDFLVAGRIFGKDLLGAYAMSFNIARVPSEKLTSIVARVTFPFFSAIQDDPAALRRYLLLLTRAIALITFPLGCGLALVADDFVLALLGPKWDAAILPLQCLAFLSLLQGIFAMVPHVLNVIGQSRYGMRVGLVAAGVMPASFLVGSNWGIVGIAAVWVTVYPAITLPLYHRLFRRLELSPWKYVAALWPASSSAAIMAVVVWLLGALATAATPRSRLALQVAGGGLAYALVVATVHGDHLQSCRRALKLMRGTTAL